MAAASTKLVRLLASAGAERAKKATAKAARVIRARANVMDGAPFDSGAKVA
jgi:hypothetical protein